MNNSNDKPYVFISYAHIDGGTVLPIIDAMKCSGINIWYDEGIEAGSEWPEYIAEKVMHCSKFLLFISRAYLDSQNCKRELNFAISRKKDILSVYLEDVELSPGMEMQLGTYQAVFRKRFSTLNLFCHSLCQEKFFAECRSSYTRYTSAQPTGNTGSTKTTQSAGSAYTANTTQAAGSAHSANPTSNTKSAQHAGNVQPTNNTQSTIDVSGLTFDEAFEKLLAEKMKNARTGTYTQSPKPQPVPQTAPKPTGNLKQKTLPVKSRKVAALLAIFLGYIGIQRFYLRQYLLGVLFILFSWTYIPAIVGLIEGVVLLLSNDEKFESNYKCIAKR